MKKQPILKEDSNLPKERKDQIKINWALIISLFALLFTTFFNVQSLKRSNEQIKITQQERIIRILEGRPRLSPESFKIGYSNKGGIYDSMSVLCTITNKGVRDLINLRIRNYVVVSDSLVKKPSLIDSKLFSYSAPLLPNTQHDARITPVMIFEENKFYYIVVEFTYDDFVDPEILKLSPTLSQKKEYSNKFYYLTTAEFASSGKVLNAENEEVDRLNAFINSLR